MEIMAIAEGSSGEPDRSLCVDIVAGLFQMVALSDCKAP